MPHTVALYTFGVFIEPADHPANDGFYERNDPIFDAVEQATGFIARSGYADEAGPKPWGEEVYPRFYEEHGDGWSPATLSLWSDLESPMAFAYSGLHAEALAHGREWFRRGEWPPYVLWWVEPQQTPTWQEAIERHQHLHDHGPTAHAFTFKRPFDASGRETAIERAAVHAAVDRNRAMVAGEP